MPGIQGTSNHSQIYSAGLARNMGPDRAGALPSAANQDTSVKTSSGTKIEPKGWSPIDPKGCIENAIQTESGKSALSKQMKQLLRDLHKTPEKPQNPFAGTTQDGVNGIFDPSGAQEEKEDEVEKPVNYNYKEVETKVQRAKTSVSAGQAVISAKRKVLEVKRKIASSDGDSEELQLALTHARRMEMVARKKKHHLELEEMVQTTGKRDERLKKQEETSTQIKNALVTAQEEEITKREDAIFDERQNEMSEASEQLRENSEPNAEQMLSDLNKMLAEFGEDELKELEEAMEMLESMEVVDPHMSKEDLEELKRKHRASEQKAMVKADMDYLKGMIKHQTQQSAAASAVSSTASLPSTPNSPSATADAIAFALPQTMGAVNQPSFTAPVSASINVQV